MKQFMLLKPGLPWVLLGAALFAGSANVWAENAADSKEEAKKADREIPFYEIRTFADIYARVKKDYVEDVDDKKLMKGAIRGMLSNLDPHSAYLDKSEYQNLHEGTTGEFGGLGIEVGMEDGLIKVISPIDDTPAQRAGILPGDDDWPG